MVLNAQESFCQGDDLANRKNKREHCIKLSYNVIYNASYTVPHHNDC